MCFCDKDSVKRTFWQEKKRRPGIDFRLFGRRKKCDRGSTSETFNAAIPNLLLQIRTDVGILNEKDNAAEV